jgi:orotate phosphoribosyltransferase
MAADTAKPGAAAADERARLLAIVKAKSLMTQGGPFKLASGGMSDYYLDLKPTAFDPQGARLIGRIVYRLLNEGEPVHSIGGLELGAVPIVIAVCAASCDGKPIQGFVVRKETKGHGTDKKIDGNFKPNTRVVLIEDVTTRGGSVMQAVRAVRDKGAKVDTVITIVDRLEGAAETLRSEGIKLKAVFTRDDLLGRK